MALSRRRNNIAQTNETTTNVPMIRETNIATTGRLKIEVFASDGAVPVENAVVQVLDNGTVIEELEVNESGEAGVLQIEAPSVELTLEAQDVEQPYRELDISITASGYENVYIEGAQIFAETEAIQQINMTPRLETTNILIPEHTLWGVFPAKIPESPVKPISDATGFQVLDEPVVPTYVVVHVGEPSAYGTNYWIPFKDYVKNVASSEIYSTWPTETIKANILAIISFVLNRVFTEWYRGKGYNFTITNSTDCDK